MAGIAAAAAFAAPCAGGATEAALSQAVGRSATGVSAQLSAAFTPNRLGAPTSIRFGVKIDPPPLRVPPPLSALDISYPADLGFATSGLGVAACVVTQAERLGARGCPSNSRLGSGGASVGIQFGVTPVTEHVVLDLFAATSTDGYLHLLIVATGKEPVQATIVMAGVLLPGRLHIDVPPVPALPGGSDVSVERLAVTLGGAITYHERVGGRIRSYRPAGISLPRSCPRSGWRFGAAMSFMGGARSRAAAVVGCPRHR